MISFICRLLLFGQFVILVFLICTFLPADSYKLFCRNFFVFFNLELSCCTKFDVSAINFAIFLRNSATVFLNIL